MNVQGVYCPAITVFNDDGTIDYKLWGKQLDRVADAGISGVLIFGSIGEFYAIPIEERLRAVPFAVKRLKGKCKAFIGVGDCVPNDVRRMVEAANKAGADAVVAVCPYYFGPSADTAVAYFKGIAALTDLPIILYNFPDRTGSDISPKLAARIVREVPSVVGIKDTVDSASHTRHVVQAVKAVRPSVGVLSGFDEYYLPTRTCGGDGVLCGMTNVEPETFVALHRAYEAEDMATAVEKAKRIVHLVQVYDVCDLFISGVKCAVKAKGLPISTKIQNPACQASEEQYEHIKQILES
ncbi:dihydrodipicolinate synthase family protein [Atopobium sp. oral taxon 416]|uniref:dihydrodipicolinate synthase family protein n=1 Tax=Atopobium sp. oral taxon 416 TaxID=712157 RepID=UPI001BA73D08|nr:dihydrodipicolinate synthase family protein [Atopobium sp. oral taxon 416]QUC04274.1 dihydrodipicolinate synthase family protein [Atopobium sp. oral taxon 416]